MGWNQVSTAVGAGAACGYSQMTLTLRSARMTTLLLKLCRTVAAAAAAVRTAAAVAASSGGTWSYLLSESISFYVAAGS
jgi:hypothetical protein